MINLQAIKNILDNALVNHHVPCSDIAVSVNNKIIYRYMNGTSDDKKKKSIKGDELYFLYSASKPITCTAALQLYERGLIGLEDYIYEYIPEFKNVVVADGTGVRPVQQHIKIRHLFTMTSGMNYDLNSHAIRAQLEINPNSSTQEFVRAMAKTSLEFEPGTRFLYGLSHDVLAAIIEVVTGMSFGEYLQKNIFDICGMKNTYVGCNEMLKDKMCSQYMYDAVTDSTKLIEKENPFILSPNYQSGGAGLVSCVEDYMLFASELVNGEKLLKRENIDLMRSEHISGAAYKDFQKLRPGYSYGLGVRTNVANKFSAIGEFGWDGAAGAYVMLDPDNHIAVFYVTHVRGYAQYIHSILHTELRDAIYER